MGSRECEQHKDYQNTKLFQRKLEPEATRHSGGKQVHLRRRLVGGTACARVSGARRWCRVPLGWGATELVHEMIGPMRCGGVVGVHDRQVEDGVHRVA